MSPSRGDGGQVSARECSLVPRPPLETPNRWEFVHEGFWALWGRLLRPCDREQYGLHSMRRSHAENLGVTPTDFLGLRL
jgi:hypothetical protein